MNKTRRPADHLFPPPWHGGLPPWGWFRPPWGWGPPPPPVWDWGNWLWNGWWAEGLADDIYGWIPQPYWYPSPGWAWPAFNYWGFSVVPVWDPYYQEWGFWVAGIWLPLPNQ